MAGNDGSTSGINGGDGGNGTAGGSAFGGVIYNLGTLTALNCQFLTNSATGGGGGAGGDGGNGSGIGNGGSGGHGGNGALGYGGAIYSGGSLSLSNCSFFGNSVTGGSGGTGGTNGTGTGGVPGTGGAGFAGSGAAVYSTNNAIILNCTFSGNVAQGGDSMAGGTDSAGNGLSGAGGANSLGGGVCNLNAGFLTNCTFYNNQVTGGNGGAGGNGEGIRSGGNGGNGGKGLGGSLYNAGNIVVVNCTFSAGGAVGGTNGLAGTGLTSGTDGAMGLGLGGDIANGSGAFTLRNSILAPSSAGTNGYDTSSSRITDGGYNISSDASLNLTGTSLKNTNPLLGSLASNGGLTQTMALLTNSPAIDRIPPGLTPPTDQRGVPRPQGPACDVGAYELVTLPAIVTQPQSQAIAQGSSATFTVAAFGDTLGDSLIYQWYFNTTNLITNAVSASYTIASVATNNAGAYDVVITDSYGAVTSAPATLTVIFPPLITVQPTNLSVLQGSNATFTVQATGLLPLSYQWQFNSTNISAATTNSYTVISAQPGDAGSYTVAITNVQGSVTSTPAILTVNVLPFITTPPSSQAVSPGSNVTFSVAAGGTPPPSYQWRFNGNNILGAVSSAYAITNAQTTNTGTYDVIIANNYGSVTSPPALLSVVLPFAISGQVLDVNGTSGLPGVLVQARTNSCCRGFHQQRCQRQLRLFRPWLEHLCGCRHAGVPSVQSGAHEHRGRTRKRRGHNVLREQRLSQHQWIHHECAGHFHHDLHGHKLHGLHGQRFSFRLCGFQPLCRFLHRPAVRGLFHVQSAFPYRVGGAGRHQWGQLSCRPDPTHDQREHYG